MKKFIQGMVKDPERVDQPDGTYRDALNANLYYQKGAVTSELGTQSITNEFIIQNIIGRAVLEDGRIVLFAKCLQAPSTVYDAILLTDPIENTTELLYRDNDLNFKVDYTIEATSKIGVNNDILVYFTDNYVSRLIETETGIEYLDDYNPPRVFNISKQLRNVTGPQDADILYGDTNYNVDKLDLFLHTGDIPEFNNVKIEEGGGVVSGTYHLALAYVDDENNITNYMTTSNPVYLVTAPEDAIPTESITGDPQGTQSNKSIIWEVTIPSSTNYKFIQPVVIQRFGGLNQESSEFAYSLQKITIPDSGELEVTYTGLENVGQASVSEVVIDKVRYESAKTLIQLDNRLFLSNLQSRGDLGYQRFANNIKINPVTELFRGFDPRYYTEDTLTEGYPSSTATALEAYNIQKLLETDDRLNSKVKKGYKDSNVSYKYKSFRRSEVYAFYISFVLKDGTESYAYHIPGREELSGRFGELDSIVDHIDANPNLGEFSEYYPDAKMYQVIDTHQSVDSDMSYWENVNEKYPDSADFDIWSVNNNGVPDETGNSLRNKNVRHHKLPSNKSEFSYISLNSGELALNSSGTTNMVESIQVLGIQLENLRIPKFILKQVQGYKIYYAKRTQQNKTIIGQSAIVPAAYRRYTTISTTLDNAKSGPFSPGWLSLGYIPNSDSDYIYSRSNYLNNIWRSIPAFSFHDFNLLKNKHTLSGATHIDIQKVMIMKMYAGTDGRKKDNDKFYVPEWVGPDTNNENVDNPGEVTGFVTSALLAHSYDNPEDIDGDTFFVDVKGTDLNLILNNLSSIYTIRPKSITYLPGSTILTNDSSTAFQGIDTIFNFSGESQIFTSLITGPPAILAWGQNIPNETTSAPWYDSETISGYTKLEALSSEFSDNRSISTFPVVYLTNMSAYKTDVFKPFDEQNLVWTGYYKGLNNVNLITGEEELEVGVPDGKLPNYYDGTTSQKIFGGDTYIGRYSFRTTGQTYGGVYNRGAIDITEDITTDNYTVGQRTPLSTLYYFICESDDLLGFRHSGDNLAGVTTTQSRFFDNDTAADVIFNSPANDGTKSDNLLYMNNYSLNQDLRVARPYPKNLSNITLFPTRTIRSNNDEGSISDKYREYLGLEYKDLPRDRGDIVKLFSLGSVLYMNTERSLFVTRGKENLQLSNGSEAFVGSGDIFTQDPEEVISTSSGYGGTDSQYTGVTTRYGHFYFNRRDKKAYILTESIVEASSAGMEKWFLDNTPYVLEQDYNISLIQSGINIDSPTSGFGFHAGYDPKYKRILLTKRERIPSQGLISALDSDLVRVVNNQFVAQTFLPGSTYQTGDVIPFSDNTYFNVGGWTLSYYPEIKVWGSRHDYNPVLYCNTPQNLYSLTSNAERSLGSQIWEHSNDLEPCNFYGEDYNFEFEFIDNTAAGVSKVFSSVYYWGELITKQDNQSEFHKVTTPVFSSYYIYNTLQISGEHDIQALVNTRLVDRFWYLNDFRDLSRYDPNQVTPVEIPMFTEEGVINELYVDNAKPWYHQKRFVDTYLGIRLISNDNRNLIYLYGAGTKHRQSYR